MHGGDAGFQGRFGIFNQLDVALLLRLAGNDADGGIGNHAFVGHTEVQADDIAVVNNLIGLRDTMNHLIIDRNTDDIRKALVARKLACRRVFQALGRGNIGQIFGRHAGFQTFLQQLQNGGQHAAAFAHGGNFLLGFDCG